MTGEKRCNDCGWEFYETKNKKCPNCNSKDWDYKLIGIKREKK